MSPEKIATGACHSCGERVAVKKNRSGLAYYRCDECGFHGQHHWHRVSGKYLESLGAVAEEKPQKTEPAQASEKPVQAVKKGGGGLLSSLLNVTE